jgi:hypothetical protein
MTLILQRLRARLKGNLASKYPIKKMKLKKKEYLPYQEKCGTMILSKD